MPALANFLQSLRPSSLFTTSRLLFYVLLSFLAVSAVIATAFVNHNNFYSVAVYLSRSNRSALILVNFAVILTCLIGRIMQQIFFGPLRTLEVERLYDRIWFFLTESLLAFTIFRDEFDVAFGAMFGFLLFIKCFHWLMSDRIELMDQLQYPGANLFFHIRIVSLFNLLSLTDIVMLAFAAESILTHGVGGIVLFGSEYAILVASALNCLAKYSIFSYDQYRARNNGGENAPAWENKSMYIFYIELVTDFLKLITYLTFFLLVLTFYGLPLNIIRDVYITGRSFYQRCRDLVRYRAATKNMDERYPDATEAELHATSDKTCIICREEMLSGSHRTTAENANPEGRSTASAGPNVTPKKLPCGHIFHFHCLRSWLERQQSCPTCRRGVLETLPQNNANEVPQPVAAARANQPLDVQAGPARILGRVFRDAGGMAPLIPGQLNPGPQPNAAAPWPYNNPGGQNHAQQPLRPAPRFQGFNAGPQGAWQPWLNDPDIMPDNHGTEPNAGQSEQTLQSNLPTNGDGVDRVNREQKVAESSSSETSARAAAAQAAIRRLQTLRRSEQPLSIPNSTSESLTSKNVASSSTTSSPALSTDNLKPLGSSTSETLLVTQGPRSSLPSLIPLFDPVLTQGTSGGSLATSLTPLVSHGHLSRLDLLTSEAIDEQLRVLDGIQTALWRSAEELLKLKSVLPSNGVPLSNPPPDTPSLTPSISSANSRTFTKPPGPQLARSEGGTDTQASDPPST